MVGKQTDEMAVYADNIYSILEKSSSAAKADYTESLANSGSYTASEDWDSMISASRIYLRYDELIAPTIKAIQEISQSFEYRIRTLEN